MISSSAHQQQQGKEVVVWAQSARTLALCVLAVSVAASFGLLLGVGPAHANTFTVNSTGDAGDNNVGNGSCFTGVFVQVGRGFEQECTLRAAIQEANVNDQSDTATFLSGLSGTITLSLGELTIADDTSATKDLIIQGPGARTMTVSGNDASRVFRIDSLANVSIGGLTISDGQTEEVSGSGGGIFNFGTLTLTNSTVSSNTAGYAGGGIYNVDQATLRLNNSTVSSNAAGHEGGGIINHGDLRLVNSTVSSNAATGAGTSDSGGGIINGGDLRLVNSTVSSNTADDGGGIYNESGDLDLNNSTVSHNSAEHWGGGIYAERRNPIIRNTIIARNLSSHSQTNDASGDYNSRGHNLIGNVGSSSGWVTSDLTDVDPLLGPLQDNGGPTPTRALLPGSPAVDAGLDAACPMFDQRGVLRNQDGDGNGTQVCDIGAFEVANTKPTITNLSPAPGSSTRDRTPLIAATVRDAQTNLAKTNIKLFVDGISTTTFSYDRLTDRLTYTSGQLSFGSHTVKIIATDGVHTTAKSWSFTVVSG